MELLASYSQFHVIKFCIYFCICFAIKGDLLTVGYLLEKGANVDASDDTGYTPLQCAAALDGRAY